MNRAVISILIVASLAASGPLSAVQRTRAQFGPRRFSDQWFDYQCFNQLSATEARKKCEQALTARLDLLEASVAMSMEQRAKLEIAGQTDIHRFFADQQEFKRSFRTGANATNIAIHASRLERDFVNGLHGSDSLFQKTLRTALEPDQVVGASQFESQRQRFIFAKHIEITLAVIDTTLPLTARQRDQVTNILLNETEPPEHFGSGIAPVFVVLLRMSQIGDTLRPVFSEDEWTVMQKIISRAVRGVIS